VFHIDRRESFVANQVDMSDLAARGAAVRLAELRAEIDALRAAFPGLEDAGANGNVTPASNGRGRRGRRAAASAEGQQRGRRAMSAAQRKAVSARMKKYWADRRKTKNAAK
jgi:hypothetical protein